MNRNKEWIANLALLFCAVIWGLNIVFQKQATYYLGAFSFISLRYYIGAVSLFPLFFVLRRNNKKNTADAQTSYWHGKKFILAAASASACNCAGALLAQIGLQTTDAAKAGFIESAYIVLVPLLQLFLFRKKTSARAWIGIGTAVIGLYLMCITDSITISRGDLILMTCTICFAMHIILWSIFSPHVNGLAFVMTEFTCTGTFAGIIALFTEKTSLSDIIACTGPLLFAGILGVGVAYSIQIYAQRYTSATIAALLMSMEAVFGLIGGVIILNESLTVREWLGCAVMLATIVFVQLPVKARTSENAVPASSQK